MTNSNNFTVKITLTRDLGLFDITIIGVGAMIGASIFVLTGIAAGHARPALLLTFFLNGLIALLTAASYAELGAALPGVGSAGDDQDGDYDQALLAVQVVLEQGDREGLSRG